MKRLATMRQPGARVIERGGLRGVQVAPPGNAAAQ